MKSGRADLVLLARLDSFRKFGSGAPWLSKQIWKIKFQPFSLSNRLVL
jgi:hypothetical protein